MNENYSAKDASTACDTPPATVSSTDLRQHDGTPWLIAKIILEAGDRGFQAIYLCRHFCLVTLPQHSLNRWNDQCHQDTDDDDDDQQFNQCETVATSSGAAGFECRSSL
ncbi:MAG: hypothetical protein R3C19_19110 [Planctomycetaceae bacterium]